MSVKPTLLLMACAVLSASASAATTWNLADDFQPNSNSNGAWTYGEVSGSSFSPLSWNAGTNSYGVAAVGYAFVYLNNAGYTAYGIDQGQVSLESDWGNAAVRWTAPSSGKYQFTIDIGGTQAWGGGGYGNNFASLAGVKVNGGSTLAADSSAGSVYSWTFTANLATNDTVDTFVINPGYASGGNTQTKIFVSSVSSVPEPSTYLLLLAGCGLILGAQRRTSKQKSAA